MGVDVHPEGQIFISGSCDETSKLWDMRTGEVEINFRSVGSEINAIKYFPDKQAFATGNDNGECVLFDVRSTQELMRYTPGSYVPATSLAFSQSGCYLFVGYDDFTVVAYQTLTGRNAYTLEGHSDRVASVGVNSNGTALASGSWDSTLKIWA